MMKKQKRVFFAITLALVLMMSTIIGVSAESTKSQAQSPGTGEGIVVQLDSNGNADLTVTMAVDENGNMKQISNEPIKDKSNVAPNEEGLASPTNGEVVPLATPFVVKFALHLKNWTSQYGDLSWDASSTLPNITSVTGTAYIKSTSILFPTTYFTKGISMYGIGGHMYATDYLGYANLKSETSVKVGFTGVKVVTVQQVCNMPNSSMIVNK